MATGPPETPPNAQAITPPIVGQASAASEGPGSQSDQRRAQLDRIEAGLGPPLDATSGDQHARSPTEDTQTSSGETPITPEQTKRDADAVKRYS